MTRKTLLLSLTLMVMATTACGGGTPDATTAPVVQQQSPTSAAPPATAVPALPTGEVGEALVARVNGTPITLEAFRSMVARFQAEPSLRDDPEMLRTVVMRTLIEQVLIEQAAAQEQISVTDAEVDAEMTRMVEAAGSEANWTNWLNQNMYTADEFRDQQRTSLLTNRMRDHVTSALDQPVEQVHARHIVVGTRDEASALLVRLRNGEDFASLAVAFSLDSTTRPTGGDLGWFTKDELLEPALANIAFELQPNQIAGPIETALGYHIIQTLEIEVRPIAEDKRAMLAQTQFEQWLASLTTNAAIEQYL